MRGSRTVALVLFLASCAPDDPMPEPVVVPPVRSFRVVARNVPAALLSVTAVSPTNVYAVGADKGDGPWVLHYDGNAWTRLRTGFRGDLWWVHAFPWGSVFAAGQGAQVLRYESGSWTRMQTPGFAKQTIYGTWGRNAEDIYFVGGAAGRDGFVWHWDGKAWSNEALPLDIPRTKAGEVPGLFKVWGGAEDVWVVGGAGAILHRKGTGPFQTVASGTTETLFTVSGAGDRVTAVGGGTAGVWLESRSGGPFTNITPKEAPLLQGVTTSAQFGTWGVGERGQTYFAAPNAAVRSVTTSLPGEGAIQSLHAAAFDSEGGLWTVGGNVLSPTLDAGVVAYEGKADTKVAPYVQDIAADGGTGDAAPPVVCPAEVVSAAKDKSIARRWNEQILASIRRDLPRPTVHARNLYHLSAAMWDAWATYETTPKGVFVREKLSPVGENERVEAISYAAYRILSQRYKGAIGGAVSVECYRAVMKDLGFDPDDTREVGDDPRALGNRIGKTILAQNAADGSNEATNYNDTAPDTNPNLKVPMLIDEPGVPAGTDPNFWQPLNLNVAATQNGIILASGVQTYIGSQWGAVSPFALTRASAAVPWHDYGDAPQANSEAMRGWVADVIRRSSELDAGDGVSIDISPGAIGNNPLGTNAGKGFPENPTTHTAYVPMVVKRGDFGRALAEFWADGPKSETPPGHWNVLANKVADSVGTTRKLFAAGASLSPLAWDMHVYLALNGALHDAAIAAWDVKRRTSCSRPITLIRYMAARGQSSEPTAKDYDPMGLPLLPGLIERVTPESAAEGARHHHLRHFVGQMVIRSWRGEPGDRTTQAAGAGWIRGVDWMPYQRRTFVTPAFPGFVSGHSTFSRAAAEVLTSLTGSPYFPNGLGSYEIPADKFLSFEKGPSAPFLLEWATYYDAADQAGQSRIWGGIHIEADDFMGRKIGHDVGLLAVTKASRFFDGSSP